MSEQNLEPLAANWMPQLDSSFQRKAWLVAALGALGLVWGFYSSAALTWGLVLISIFFWGGLAAGLVATRAIVQIVGAKWAEPIKPLAEAGARFLPTAWFLMALTWFGRQALYPWANGPLAGREWWMQPGFVYLRDLALLAALFYFLRWFAALARQNRLSSGAEEQRLSFFAPLVIIAYAVVFTLFAFEMLLAMDHAFMSNLFGAYVFIGNVYLAWAALAMMAAFFQRRDANFCRAIGVNQFWDLGKLTFGFCMIWGYFVFSQFLPIWYGNLPEETQWMILRTRELPWQPFSWLVFSLCFVLPFILLLSRDVKRTPGALASVCALIVVGKFLEYYLIVVPQISGATVPLAFWQLLIFLGVGALFCLQVGRRARTALS